MMFGLFKSKPSNGWQRLAKGADIPAKPGQKFDVRFTRDCEVHGLVAGIASITPATDGGSVDYNGATIGVWFDLDQGRAAYITHYRLHKPVEISDETAARAALDNRMRDWLSTPSPEADDGFRYPTRKPVRVR